MSEFEESIPTQAFQIKDKEWSLLDGHQRQALIDFLIAHNELYTVLDTTPKSGLFKYGSADKGINVGAQVTVGDIRNIFVFVDGL